jgi:hypothetical protein
MPDLDLTPTQRRVFLLLQDGQPHAPREIRTLLPEDLGSLVNVRQHLSRLRRKLRPAGQDIRFERLGLQVAYRLVSLSQG